MKIKHIISIVISVLLFTGCSPVDKVKWSKIDLLGNEIRVNKIVSRIRGDSGEVIWKEYPQKINKDCDVVSVLINRKGTMYFLNFSYERSKDECRLLEYRINGKPESPLYIYRFLSVSRNYYIPKFIEQFL